MTDENQEFEKLKHCPFCGKGNSQVQLYETDYRFWTIGCGACGSHSGISKDPKKVVDSWNSRPHEPKD